MEMNDVRTTALGKPVLCRKPSSQIDGRYRQQQQLQPQLNCETLHRASPRDGQQPSQGIIFWWWWQRWRLDSSSWWRSPRCDSWILYFWGEKKGNIIAWCICTFPHEAVPRNWSGGRKLTSSLWTPSRACCLWASRRVSPTSQTTWTGCAWSLTSHLTSRKRRPGLSLRWDTSRVKQYCDIWPHCARSLSFRTLWMIWPTALTKLKKKISDWSPRTACWASTLRTSCRPARSSKPSVQSREGRALCFGLFAEK